MPERGSCSLWQTRLYGHLLLVFPYGHLATASGGSHIESGITKGAHIVNMYDAVGVAHHVYALQRLVGMQHAALINVQRICDYVAEGLSYDQAIELVRASSLYTVHTPVPAGHDYFDEGLFGKYMGGYPARMGISWEDLMDLGRNNPGDKGERFCMSVFACNTSQEVNGVSWLHGKVSQEMFSTIWKGYFPEASNASNEPLPL